MMQVPVPDPNNKKEVSKFMQAVNAWELIHQHIENLLSERKLILTGDTEHLSIQFVLDEWSKIDKPKKYRTQADNEKCFKNTFDHFIPNGPLGCLELLHLDEEMAKKIISGEESITVNLGYSQCCYDCMSKFVTKISGNSIHLSCKEKCQSSREFTVEIDFPTGEIVFADWPTHFTDAQDAGILSNKHFEINYLKGIKERTQEFEKANIFHSFVSNTSPRLCISKGLNKIRIGKTAKGFKEAGYFCTDLWWTTIIDKKFHDQIIAKIPNREAEEEEREIAKIKPGRYRFTIHDIHNKDENSTTLYSSAEWIGECLKTDFVFEEKSLMEWDDVVQTSAAKWVSGNISSISSSYSCCEQRVTDQIFNVLGSGYSSYGDLISDFSTEQKIAVPKENFKNEDPEQEIPYPNFQKQYSLVWKTDISKLPNSWIEAAINFYTKSLDYFNSGGGGYSYAYEPESPKNKRLSQDLLDYVNKKRDKFRNDQDFYDHITKEYGGVAIWNGDVEQFRAKRWEIEKNRIIEFCKETIEMLKGRLE